MHADIHNSNIDIHTYTHESTYNNKMLSMFVLK